MGEPRHTGLLFIEEGDVYVHGRNKSREAVAPGVVYSVPLTSSSRLSELTILQAMGHRRATCGSVCLHVRERNMFGGIVTRPLMFAAPQRETEMEFKADTVYELEIRMVECCGQHGGVAGMACDWVLGATLVAPAFLWLATALLYKACSRARTAPWSRIPSAVYACVKDIVGPSLCSALSGAALCPVHAVVQLAAWALPNVSSVQEAAVASGSILLRQQRSLLALLRVLEAQG